MAEIPDRNLGLELLRVTEAAALAASRWVGRGQKEAGDGAAVDAMRLLLSSVEMNGTIVIGEGEKDEAPMLYNGESVGNGKGHACDVAVDPVEGTNLLAKGLPNSIAVIAVAPRGAMWDPGPAFYMDKLVVGPEAAGKVDLDASVEENLKAIADAKGIRVTEVTVVLLERERNLEKIRAIRDVGARIRLISDGDVAPALMSALPDTGIDAVMGIGGTPEGVITACAVLGLGGEMQGRLAPQSDMERKRVLEAGYDLDRKLTHSELVSGEDTFFAATGITQGSFLGGVRYTRTGATTTSLVIRSHSGTWRRVDSHHRWEKLSKISAVPYHPM
ncbi:class II fructose-bisphosphatase [Sulfidibacter corallicola]|uniref:Fructose-1,6-bisphosphatase n=1 Tax=Sulfidibacter corallicola TaxID=2818388 RepID=A0A8A4TP57_SULCO|nr:class II fructose-bisphosphatase [Sulfidibacter corallicola]QTD50984.1 class II fructose-bisphosphatase [Sulfidibacter corallicola]